MAVSSVRLRLLGALVAFAAGIVAIAVVALLARTTLDTSGPSTGAATPAAAPPASPTATAAGPAFPNPPAGALVQAKEDRDLAVGFALAGDSAQVSVVGQEGPASGLSVSVNSVRAKACGPGCYSTPRPVTPVVEVGIRGRNRPASTVEFRQPLSPHGPPAAAVVAQADRAWRALQSLVVHDRLSSGPGSLVETVWQFVAPHRMTYRIRNGPAAVAIGSRRWDKLPGRRWEASEQDPITEPIPLWESVSNAHLLGSGTLRGHAVWKVSFFDAQIPAWFTIWVDKATARTLELRMIAQAHFMHQVYGPFNRPLRIVPPV
jgi:hypothetical protein